MDRCIPHLSGRERQVLQLVGRGLTNKEIARALGIASRTVEFHLTRIFKKLDVTGRTAAFVMAEKLGVFGEKMGG
jgi:RNA polymerase sigma factor (sigma-70 family)